VPRVVPPLAVYAEVPGVDPAPGIALLEEAGFAVRRLVGGQAITQAEAGAVALLADGSAPVGAEVLDALPELRIVATMSAGVEVVDLDRARARGIWVANVPAASTEEVAVHAFAMGLSLLRELPFLDRAVRAGRWGDAGAPARRPSDATLGLLGLGRIGRRVGALGGAVYGRVIGHDPILAGDDWPTAVERMERKALLATADVLSLHLPLTPQTRHLIDGTALALMRPGAFLVNVSRGGLVEPRALLAALDGGHLAGAALDVFEAEPPRPDDPLLHHPRTLVTPHVAYHSAAAARAYVLEQARNVVAWRSEGRPLDVVVTGR
jgi:phosphoglycerate dehydrogenase-like enzyme